MLKIAIIGYGYVGKAMFTYFKSHYQVIYHDPYLEGSCTLEQVNECDMGVICVNTQSVPESGQCDTSIVESVLNWLTTPLILIKSTVQIGFTKRMIALYPGKNICFSPEYIGESLYDTGRYNFNTDMKNHSFFTFGGPKDVTQRLVPIFQKISGPSKIYKQTDETCAEIAKYMENSFLATKLVFCYEMDQICKINHVDYNEVRELFLLDPRMSPSHTCVFESQVHPFDGKCLPKDIKALLYQSRLTGYEPDFLKEVLASNDRIGKLRVQSDSVTTLPPPNVIPSA